MDFKYKHGSPGFNAKTNRLYRKYVKEVAESDMTTELVNDFLCLCCETLHDEFGFGDKRMNEFRDALMEKVDCINNDYVNWNDITGNFKMIEK